MTEEEEASAPTRTFSSTENHVAVVLGTQAVIQDLEAREVVLESVHEGRHPVVSDFNIGVDDQRRLSRRAVLALISRRLPLTRVLDLDLAQTKASVSSFAITLESGYFLRLADLRVG